jgi:hypothetical protein
LFSLYMGLLAVAIVNSYRTEFSLKVGVASQRNPDRYGTWTTIQQAQARLFLHGIHGRWNCGAIVFKTSLRSALLTTVTRKNQPGPMAPATGSATASPNGSV